MVIIILSLCLAYWLAQQSEHICFNYPGSFWMKLDGKMRWGWFKLNSRPDLVERFPYFPFVWDGYHCFKWFADLFKILPTGILLFPYYGWWVVPGGLALSVWLYVQNQLTYSITFKGQT